MADILKSMNFAAQTPTAASITDPLSAARAKMLENIGHQIALAKDPGYTKPKIEYVDNGQGERIKQETQAKVRSWITTKDDLCYIVVRYGAQKLAFAKDKVAITCKPNDVLKTLEQLSKAVEGGELDELLKEKIAARKRNKRQAPNPS